MFLHFPDSTSFSIALHVSRGVGDSMSNRGTLFSSWEETFEELETVCLTGAPCSHPGRKHLRCWRQCV